VILGEPVRLSLAAAALTAAFVVPALLPAAAEASPALQLGRIQYDSPGTDTRTNASLNAEYVTIKNVSSTKSSLSGFTLRDAQSHVYTFGTFALAAGKSVRLHTGKGTNTSTDRFWGSAAYIWNNTGDKASLKTHAGSLVDSCSWTSTGAGYKYC
jgi:hypothetical protein